MSGINLDQNKWSKTGTIETTNNARSAQQIIHAFAEVLSNAKAPSLLRNFTKVQKISLEKNMLAENVGEFLEEKSPLRLVSRSRN